MHKDFAEWYRLASIEPNADILPKRWTAIAKYVPGRDEIISLARLFYRLGKPEQEFLATFVDAFQQTDPAFKTRENEHELSLLAGAELIDVIQRGEKDSAVMAALSLVCAPAGNTRSCPCVADIPEIAVHYLSTLSKDRISIGKSDTESEPRKAMFDALVALGPPHSDLAKEYRQLHRQVGIINEESNMLWWLFSEYSRDEDRPWKSFSVPAVAIMAGKELADLTQIIPGPISAIGFQIE